MLCSWVRHCHSPHSPQECEWVLVNCQGNLTKCWGVTYNGLESHPWGVAILLATLCCRNWYKLQQCECSECRCVIFLLTGMLLLYTKGRPSGDAYVQLVSSECAKTATTDLHRQHMGERYIEVFPCSGVDIASIITSSTINQTKMASLNTPYSHPCSYPVSNGVVTSPNGTHMNGHTDNVTATPACRSPTGVYHVPHSPTYFNCVMPTNGIGGGGSVSYFPPASTNMRMRMSPFLPQPYEMMPFFQGYQVSLEQLLFCSAFTLWGPTWNCSFTFSSSIIDNYLLSGGRADRWCYLIS